jgi:uncharacterized protein
VTDSAGKLSDADRHEIDERLRSIEASSGVEISVFVAASLDGEPIEDVAYETARAWKLGTKGTDRGVLLVIAPKERKIRIETAKGVGGDLTDLQTNEIIRERIAPLLKQDDFRGAILGGIDGIASEMKLPGAPPPRHRARPDGTSGSEPEVAASPFTLGAIVLLVVIFMVLSSIFRRIFGGRGGRGGGGGFWYGGGGSAGGGGGGWGGGGGDWGGGGSSGDY